MNMDTATITPEEKAQLNLSNARHGMERDERDHAARVLEYQRRLDAAVAEFNALHQIASGARSRGRAPIEYANELAELGTSISNLERTLEAENSQHATKMLQWQKRLNDGALISPADYIAPAGPQTRAEITAAWDRRIAVLEKAAATAISRTDRDRALFEIDIAKIRRANFQWVG
jgi:hypothetical protein